MKFAALANEINDRFSPAFGDLATNIAREFPAVKVKVYSANGKDWAVHQSYSLILNCICPNPELGDYQVIIIIDLKQSTSTAPVTVNGYVGWATYEFDQTELVLFPDRVEANESSFRILEASFPKLSDMLKATIRKCMGFARKQSINDEPVDSQENK